MPDHFFNRNLPRIAQCSSDGFDGLAPIVLIALLEMIAFVRKLGAQTCGDVADPARFEWRFITAKPGLISTSADGANRHLGLGLSIAGRAIQLK